MFQIQTFKIEFGKTVNDDENKLILADEISPDNCRLWDKNTKKNFDKDIFRNNTGDLIEGYQEIVKRSPYCSSSITTSLLMPNSFKRPGIVFECPTMITFLLQSFNTLSICP